MAVYKIPLVPAAQQLAIALGGRTYTLHLQWNEACAAWVLDIHDEKDSPILTGLPLVANTDLLGQYDYLGFGGSLVAQTDTVLNVPPTYGNLGVTGNLYFVTP